MNDKEHLIEIIEGFSPFSFQSDDVYFKHLSFLDTQKLLLRGEEFTEDYVKRGLKKEEDLLRDARQKKIWSEEKEDRISFLRSEVNRLNQSIDKLIFEPQILQVEKLKEGIESELYSLLLEKNSLIEFSAENKSGEKLDEYILYHSLYKGDKRFFYNEEEFNELDLKSIFFLRIKFRDLVSSKTHKIMRKLSVMLETTLYMWIYEDPLHNFTNKPLSTFQLDLARYIKYYKSVFANKNVPRNIAEDPDEIDQWLKDEEKYKNTKVPANKYDEISRKLGNESFAVFSKA